MTEPTTTATITAPFTFSQSSLSDFDRCRRLFWLRYIEHLEWPATAASRERELNLRERKRFHRLLHQYHLGVDVSAIIDAAPAGSDLREWWGAFQRFPPPGLDGETHPEVMLTTPLAGHLLSARLDLLAIGADNALTIIDWKTGRSPAGDQVREGWQTLVYQYVLAVAGAPYLGDAARGVAAMPTPEDIQMVYWYAELPASPAILPYGAERHQEVERRLMTTIEGIAGLSPAEFTPCEDESACRFCAFQSYCKRVPDRADLADDEYPDTEEWDWSDVPEYEY